MSGPTSIKTPFKVNELLIRSQGYQRCALLLRQPSRKEVDLDHLLNDLRSYEERVEELEVSWKSRLRDALKKLNRLLAGITQEEWLREYEFCFGHTAHSRVPAYELEYGEQHQHREPQELADITAFYQAFGLQVSGKSHERGDHISVECEFLHFLFFKIAYALEREEKEHVAVAEEAARKFLTDHLGRWLPAFALRLRRVAREEWMRAVADFCLCFLLTECEVLGIEAGDENLPLRRIEEKVETGCVSCQLSPFAGEKRSIS